MLLLAILYGIESHAEDPLVSREHLVAPVPAMSMIIALVLSVMAAENIVVPQYFARVFGGVGRLGWINSVKMVFVFAGMLVV